MLISCKCLNFIGTSNNQLSFKSQPQNVPLHTVKQEHCGEETAALTVTAATTDLKENIGSAVSVIAMQQSESNSNSTITATSSKLNNNIMNSSKGDDETYSLINSLRQAFLQKYQRNFVFYSQCVDFFKQAIGPLSDVTVNNVSQKDLIYSLTLEVPDAQTSSISQSSWQLSICSNCNVALCAKRLHISTQQFLINCGLLTNNEELSQKRSDKSFSDTFGILIMDHPKLEVPNNQNCNSSSNLGISSLSTSYATSFAVNNLDSKQLRLRQLQSYLQQRLQREIAETDERIQRYTAQQFALLKNFREKSEQEYEMLVALIQCIPDQQSNELLDRQPPILDASNNSSINVTYASSRRRNTISSRRELNTTSISPSTLSHPPNNIFVSNKENQEKNTLTATLISPTSAILTNLGDNTLSSLSSDGKAAAVTTQTSILSGSSDRNPKMSNFNTPPITPEAMPIFVGNSPTFRQQQQTVSCVSHQLTFQRQFPATTVDTADDCLFELEGIESNVTVIKSQPNRTIYLQSPPSPLQAQQTENIPHDILPNSNRNLSDKDTQSENNISDLEESDGAEEAEDALDLDTSIPIATPQRRLAQASNFAKSLPIDIANSPLAVGRSYITTLESEKGELDNNLDIAASIKALAKSVHGEAVFGDLPRPRLRSQI